MFSYKGPEAPAVFSPEYDKKRADRGLARCALAAQWGKRVPKESTTAGYAFIGDDKPPPWYPSARSPKPPAWWQRHRNRHSFVDDPLMAGGKVHLQNGTWTFTETIYETVPYKVCHWMRIERVYTVPLKDWWAFQLGDRSAWTPVETRKVVYSTYGT